MARSPALLPTQQDALALHGRLLARDPTAGNDLAEAYLELLVVWLGETNPRAPEDIRAEAAGEAIVNFIRHPEKYSPQRQTLEVFLRLSARADLRNLFRNERRHARGRKSWKSVELSPAAGKYLGRDDDPSLPMRLAEEMQAILGAIPASVRQRLSPTDLRGMELIVLGERRDGVYAELYGLLDRPAEEQHREVKRHKDRLKKILKRAGRKP
jgi:RNA polymerase sigma-70 factor (ECF subfamily)